MTTTIYLTQEQAKSVQQVIKDMRMDGWHIDGVDLVIHDDGACMMNLTGDMSYKFLFQLGMKSGYLLAQEEVNK